MTGNHAPTVLPSYAIKRYKKRCLNLGKQIKGFDRPDALLTGVETRTSAPIRIRRHVGKRCIGLSVVNTAGLYPAGEGAGYAGGIMSAAIDGIKVAEALAEHYLPVASSPWNLSYEF